MRKKINPQQEPKSILRSPGTMSSTPRRRVKFEGLSSPEDEALLDSAINDLASGTSSTANLVTEDNHRASIPAGSEGMPPAGEPSSDPVRSLDSILATVGCLLKVEIADRLRASKEMIVEQMRVIEELKNEVMCLAAKAEADKEEMERLKRFEARVLDAVKETGRI